MEAARAKICVGEAKKENHQFDMGLRDFVFGRNSTVFGGG